VIAARAARTVVVIHLAAGTVIVARLTARTAIVAHLTARTVIVAHLAARTAVVTTPPTCPAAAVRALAHVGTAGAQEAAISGARPAHHAGLVLLDPSTLAAVHAAIVLRTARRQVIAGGHARLVLLRGQRRGAIPARSGTRHRPHSHHQRQPSRPSHRRPPRSPTSVEEDGGPRPGGIRETVFAANTDALSYHSHMVALWLSLGAVSLCLLLLAELRGRPVLRAVSKLACSAGFLLLASSGDADSTFARWMLAGLALSALGDAALLSRRTFLAGLGAFLAAHVAYTIAFAPESEPSGFAALPLIAVGAVVVRWLWPRLGSLRVPVLAYCGAISAMVWVALGTGRAAIAVGAGLFYLSDVAVARQRFVRDDVRNRLVGLPLYYAAQYLLAWMVRSG
jgi:uncharacterized membrane protein YhhN